MKNIRAIHIQISTTVCKYLLLVVDWGWSFFRLPPGLLLRGQDILDGPEDRRGLDFGRRARCRDLFPPGLVLLSRDDVLNGPKSGH